MSDGPRIAEAFIEYRRTGDRQPRNWLIEQHQWLAEHCAWRFTQRGEPRDDLLQVARLGMLKAVERFQPSYGTTFATFAVPTVMGELRRHFRDATWSVRVPRSVKDRYLELRHSVEVLAQRNGRNPTAEELAAELRLTVDEVLEAMEAGTNYRATPFVTPGENDDESEEPSAEPGGWDEGETHLLHAELRVVVRQAMGVLSERDRTILFLRYFEDLTQSEIAKRLRISQVHVSRLLRSSLSRLQRRLAEDRSPLEPEAAERAPLDESSG